MTKLQELERNLIKKYRKSIWTPFCMGLKKYELINEGDKIAVCISGGKDSMILAKCIQELKRHGRINFDVEYIVMDPGYNDENLQLIKDNAEFLNIPIRIFTSNIFDAVVEMDDSPCYICARMRRGYLYRYAIKLGCNKIALGHHFDDVIETTLMSVLYNGQFKTMMPKLKSTSHDGLELIRPLYLVKEQSIIDFRNYHNLRFLQCACRFTEYISHEEHKMDSKREEMKYFIKKLRERNPLMDKNIFRSLHNVNLDTIIGYQKNNEIFSFLDDY